MSRFHARSPTIFRISINDFANGLSSNAKAYAEDISLFSVVNHENTTAKELNNELGKINRWAYQWKMSFNGDPSKEAQEVIFCRKTKKEYHPHLGFNNNNVSEANWYNHLGVFLDDRLSFEYHLKIILNKVDKTIGLLSKLQNILRISAQLTLYKIFIRLHLDCSGIIYDQAHNVSIHQKLALLHCNACLAITGAIRCTSRGILYKELGLEN